MDYNLCYENNNGRFCPIEWSWDCYWFNVNCEDYNGCNNYNCLDNQVEFLDWVECHEANLYLPEESKKSSEECGDLSKLYYLCYSFYNHDWCDRINQRPWYDCYHRDLECDLYK